MLRSTMLGTTGYRHRRIGPGCRCVVAAILVGLLLPGISSAQGLVDGFMRGAGRTNVAVSYSYESYDTYLVNKSETQNTALGTISTQSVSLFVAGGITDYLDVVLGLPYISAKASEGTLSPQSGFQDFSAYLKARPLQLELPEAKLSGIVAGGIAVPVTDYVGDFPVAIGHHSTNLDGRLVVQYTMDMGLFAAVQGGYIHRSNVTLDHGSLTEDRGAEVAVPDAVDFIGKVGFFNEDFYVAGWINRQNAQSGTNIGPGVAFPSNAQSFTKIGLDAYYPLPFMKSLGVSLGFGTVVDGRNVGKATRFSGGIAYGLPEWGGVH